MEKSNVRFALNKNKTSIKINSIYDLSNLEEFENLKDHFRLFEQNLRQAAAEHLLKKELGEKKANLLHVNVKGELTS